MSEHASPTGVMGNAVTLETGLEAFRASPEFGGPVEGLDGHRCNDHFAQIYESDQERFAAAVPFVRHGLDGDERVMYVVETHREPEVRAALRDGGIDVDAALDAGQLSFHTAEETYLRNDSFEPDEMIEFYGDTVDAATEEYEALRIVAETTWLDGDAITYEQFMEYEARVNQLFDATDSLALCQYDRRGFPPEFIRHIVESHPHLIYDGAVCHNVYYTPPAEIFDDDPAREVDRMLGTLHDRTMAKTELEQRDRFLRDLHQITADQTRSFEEKVHALLDLGREQFGLDVGGVNRIDADADHFEVEYLSGDHECFEPGAEFPLSDTYCQAAADIEGAALVSDPVAEGLDSIPVFDEYGVEGYIGTYIPVDGGMDRTLGFVPADGDPVSFSEDDRTYLELMGQWLGYELNRRQREEFLRKCYEITSDSARGFEAKLDALFDLGRERFDLDIGGLSKVDPDTDHFEVEAVSGDHDHFEPGARTDLSETYCRLVTEDGETTAVTDPIDAGFEGNVCYEEFGVRSYLGTHFEIDGGMDRTFWFVSTEPRDCPLTDEDRTLVHLMGQWVQYELERRQRERELERTKTRFETVFEQSSDGIFLIDPEADVLVDANRAAAEMTGYTHDELLSLAPSDLHPNELGQFRRFLDEVHETGSAWTEDLHCRHKDGREIPAEVSASTISLDGRKLVLANVRHIEERKKHEQYQRELYEIIADQTASADEKFERMLALGCERLDLPVGLLTRERGDAFEIEQMHGSHPDLGEGTHTPPLTDNYCRRVVDTGEPVSVVDAGEAGWDGDALFHEFGLECYAGVQLTVGDEAYGTICFTDLSPREAEFTDAEQTFLDLMGQCASYELERNHREAELEQQNDQLESFASMLAHELRNPVTIGQIYSQQLPDETDATAVDYVVEAFDRIEDMINVMLVLTRGREAVGKCTPVELGATAREAWEDVDARDAALDVAVEQTIPADEVYIRHLFRNLLENSVEHGGRDVAVTVGELDDGFYVADDGTGIPPGERDAVFDEGYTTAADTGGTGLGLAFVRKLAEVYEWEITVTESDAGGARFEFRNVA